MKGPSFFIAATQRSSCTRPINRGPMIINWDCCVLRGEIHSIHVLGKSSHTQSLIAPHTTKRAYTPLDTVLFSLIKPESSGCCTMLQNQKAQDGSERCVRSGGSGTGTGSRTLARPSPFRASCHLQRERLNRTSLKQRYISRRTDSQRKPNKEWKGTNLLFSSFHRHDLLLSVTLSSANDL